MKWRIKEVVSPKGGDERVRYEFAWRPTPVGRHIVWLERYAIRERFFEPRGGLPGWWSLVSTETLDYY